MSSLGLVKIVLGANDYNKHQSKIDDNYPNFPHYHMYFKIISMYNIFSTSYN